MNRSVDSPGALEVQVWLALAALPDHVPAVASVRPL